MLEAGPPFLPTATLRFVLEELPADTPEDSRFFLQTNVERYRPDHPELEFVREGGRAALTRDYPVGTLLSFKVTRGNQNSEEGDAWGGPTLNRHQVVTGDAEPPISVRSWRDLHRRERPSTRSGSVDSVEVYSPQLGEEIETLVYLPPSAAQSGPARDRDRRYPVLYLHDGANVFDAATSYGGVEWGADEAAEGLAREGLEAILVAVPSRSLHRSRDYTPFKSRVNGHAPGAANLLAFFTETLKPLVDARYPTRQDAAGTGVAGSSLGGLVSLFMGLSRPDTFGFVGAFSPSLWVGDGEIFDWTAHQKALPGRVYVDVGEYEGEDLTEAAHNVWQARHYAAQLAARGAEVRFGEGKGHWHDERSWAERFPAALRFFLEGARAQGG